MPKNKEILFTYKLTLDHKIPRCHGGQDTIENLQPAHQICNSIKSDLMPNDFEAKKEELFVSALTNWKLKRKEKEIILKALNYIQNQKHSRK